MKQPISILLVGIGGYGNTYVSELLDTPRQADFVLAGAVDPAPATCRRLTELQSRGIKIYPSLPDFYAASRADLAILSVPIHLHARLMQCAVEHATHVLCEKPLGATPQDAQLMAEAQQQSGRHVAIGYQWSYSLAIQALKADIAAGLLGRANRLKSLVLWPRDMDYYHRNSWAGAIKDAHGHWVLDSPVHNAAAHYLHNMFYVLQTAPADVSAQVYRLHPIANYDTAIVRCLTTAGAEIFFVTSHATRERNGPVFHFDFEKATVTFHDGGTILAQFHDGTSKDYGSPDADRLRPLWQTIAAITRGQPSICGIPQTLPQVQFTWAIHENASGIHPIPPGRDADLLQCYQQSKLPTELNFPWAKE